MSAIFVPTAEAAFLSELTDRQIQRVVDEQIVAPPLVRTAGGRFFARLAAAFAKFYFDQEEILTAYARREAIKELADRVQTRADAEGILDLRTTGPASHWEVELHHQRVSLQRYVVRVRDRVKDVEHARRLIVEDPAILGGAPVLKGTRLPVETAVAMAQGARSVSDLHEVHPALTAELIAAAQIFMAVQPRRGRPPHNQPSGWTIKSRKAVRAAQRPA
jgi:uncharacterized protein (DUF433 family)